jgi:uncharacterized protein
MLSLLKKLCLMALILVPAFAGAESVAVPPLKSRVTDLTWSLTPEEKRDLENMLAEFEKRKGSQVAVLIVPTTGEEDIEQYSMRVVEAWKLGRKEQDDGVLLLVAKNDRKLRIEVGYGLEGILPDVVCKRIIRNEIAPEFKKGNFYQGIHAGLEKILNLIEKEELAAPDQSGSPEDGEDMAAFLVLGLILSLFAFILGLNKSLGRAIVSVGFISVLTAVLFGFIGFSVGIFLASLLPFIINLISTIRGSSSGWSSGSDSSGGFWASSGSSWSSSDSGWSSSDSDFGGGGGDFGGGGSSGDW